MQFIQLKEEVKHLAPQAIRTDNDNYFEAVIIKDRLAKLSPLLEEAFDAYIWPSKEKLPLSTLEVINNFGGIRDNQTLYFCYGENYCMFAMLWPWGDGQHVTLKIGQR